MFKIFNAVFLIVDAKKMRRKNAPMKFLKDIREERGLTRYGMAKLLGMIPGTYYNYEDTAQGIQLAALVRIKRRLGLSWEELGRLIEAELKPEKEASDD